MTTKVLSLGGGLDSFTMLVKAIQIGELPNVVVFCDVADPGKLDPGEWPGTYRHVEQVVKPLCERHGIEFVWLNTEDYPVRDARSLFDWMRQRNQVPMAGPARICTTVAKVERFERWMNDRFPGQEVEVWIGFEAGEEDRVAKDPNAGKARKPKPGKAVRRNRFPLMEWGLCRCRCEALVRAAGFPVPRKSACVFCPYGKRRDWRVLRDELPEQWDRVVKLEADKPLTSNGVQIGIMGQGRLRKDGSRAPTKMLPEWVDMVDRQKHDVPCKVCGAAVKATKAAGCGWLDEENSSEAAA